MSIIVSGVFGKVSVNVNREFGPDGKGGRGSRGFDVARKEEGRKRIRSAKHHFIGLTPLRDRGEDAGGGGTGPQNIKS